jgi:hypothetical protein
LHSDCIQLCEQSRARAAAARQRTHGLPHQEQYILQRQHERLDESAHGVG